MLNPEKSSFEILLNVSRELASSLNLHTVLERVLNLSTSNLEAESASLVILDEKSEPVDAVMLVKGSLVATTVEQMKEVITSGLAGWVIRNKKAALLPDTLKDTRWITRPLDPQYSLKKSALCVPVLAHQQLVGVLTIVHTGLNFFTEEHLALQQSIADMAGFAIYNARLYENIQTAKKRYYDLFEESVNPILITDLKGRILEANRQAITMIGFTMEELIQLKIENLHAIEKSKTGQNYELIAVNGSITYESNLMKKGGELLPIEVHVSPITIESNLFAQWIFQDIKSRKELEKLREDLSAMIYHDLRSPLANIISSLDIMSSMINLEQNPQLKSVFHIATRSTERLSRMINGLLDTNRLNAGQQLTEKKPASLAGIISEAVDTITPIAESREISIEPSLELTLPSVKIDSDMIRRVFVNLLENAVKFSPNGSRIKIGAKMQDQAVYIWVDDQGNGIPEESREQIFDKYVQLPGGHIYKGLGLGLAFCKLAVEAHGGKIWVENLPQGGSRFIFTLPLDS